MKNINFNNKTFLLIDNSEKGTVNSDTVFKYQQEGNLVTAEYSGGTVVYGNIIAKLIDNQLHMLYQCMTTDDELKAGKAIAQISINEHNKIQLKLDWEWLGSKNDKGVSEYLEV